VFTISVLLVSGRVEMGRRAIMVSHKSIGPQAEVGADCLFLFWKSFPANRSLTLFRLGLLKLAVWLRIPAPMQHGTWRRDLLVEQLQVAITTTQAEMEVRHLAHLTRSVAVAELAVGREALQLVRVDIWVMVVVVVAGLFQTTQVGLPAPAEAHLLAAESIMRTQGEGLPVLLAAVLRLILALGMEPLQPWHTPAKALPIKSLTKINDRG